MTVPNTYTVLDGDTLSGISAKLFTGLIHELNRDSIGDDPDVIREGDDLLFPTPTGVLVVTVRKGDTLSELTARHLWPWLYLVNTGVVGGDPDHIEAGQVLEVPRLVRYIA